MIIRWSRLYVEIGTSYFVFSRFLLGFVIVCLTMILGGHRLVPRKYHFLIGRTVANSVAVFCFFKAVDVGTLAEANILNMTYPLFVALFSWYFVKGQRDEFSLAVVGVAFAGIWMILSPGDISFRLENLWGLVSGVTAAAAMIYLNLSRRYHDPQTILFFMFGLGSVTMLGLFRSAIFLPDQTEFFFLFTCSAVGVLGQYLLTYGFLFVTAVEGSIISSGRILLAAMLGPLLVGDPKLTMIGWCGACLIFLATRFLPCGKREFGTYEMITQLLGILNNRLFAQSLGCGQKNHSRHPILLTLYARRDRHPAFAVFVINILVLLTS